VRDRGRGSGAFTIRVVLGALLALLLPSPAALPLDRPPTVQLVDRDPGQGAVLREGEPLYLRLRYRSAVPIRIQVVGYLRRDFVSNLMQDPEKLFPAGNREVTVWLAYLSEADIDHVRIELWNADWWRLTVADIPIRAVWSGTGGAGGASRGTTKSWVAELMPDQQERMAEILSAAATVQLVDRDPGQGAVLREREPLYLRLRYRSASPIHIEVVGYLRGDSVHPVYRDREELFPAGNREVTVWLAYAYPSEANIDRVRIELWNADWARLAIAEFPIRAAWSGTGGAGGASRGTTKSWVTELTPGQQERMARMLRKTPVDVLFYSVPTYFLLQVVLTLCTSGVRRLATLAPLVIMGPVLAYTVLAYGQSNLWPLLLLFSAPWAALYLIVLTVILLLWRLVRAA
jgi:hypothetical protein